MMFWLSFCDTDKPEGTQFLGVAIVEVLPPFTPRRSPLHAKDNAFACALERSHAIGVNPGGEVGSMEIPAAHEERMRPHLDRLITRAELEELGL